MFNIFKKNKPVEYVITWKFIGEDEIYTTEGYSCGVLATMADPMVEVISITKK